MSALELECITCRSHLSTEGDTLVCGTCGSHFPIIAQVPCILPTAPTGQQRAQSEYFDAEFASYDRYEPERWRQSFVRRIFDALDIPGSGGPYLDVGVGGSGATVIEAARAGTSAVGCDLSVEGVVRAQRFAEAERVRDATFVACAAESLPFPDSGFASASCVAVLEHTDDDERVASELARVLKPDGLVWITVPNAYRHIAAPFRPLYRRHDRIVGHKRHYDHGALTEVMRRAGLAHVRTEYSGHLVKVGQLILDRLIPTRHGLRSKVWWQLEEADLRRRARPRHAFQLSAVFRRV